MKKIALLIALLPLAIVAMGQRTAETVYLKNGGLVKGEIIEQVPGQSLKVKTKDGNVFVYQMDEIERIAKETQTDDSNGRHRGLDFSVDLGYDISTKGGDGALAAELELGKRFSKSFYWGIGGGAYIPTGSGDPMIPITTNARVFMPISGAKISPFVGLKAGYVLNTAGDVTVGTGKYKQTVEMPDYIMVQIMPGFQYPLSNGIDFNFGAGYTHFIPASSGNSYGAIAIRAGFNFHKGNTTKAKSPRIPTRDKGPQITLEGGKMGFGMHGSKEYDGFLGDIVLSYKLNPNLSIGIGGGVDAVHTEIEDGIKRYLLRWDGDEYNNTYEFEMGNFTATKAFIRGQYRLTDKKLSPFASCDVGLRFYSYDDTADEHTYFYKELEKQYDVTLGDFPSTAFFVSPAIGLSLRTFNNSYLELKVGYSLSSGDKSKHIELENSRSDIIQQVILDREKVSFSAPYVTLGWTHTFGSRKR